MPSKNEFRLIEESDIRITAITYVDGSLAVTAGKAFESPPTFRKDGATWTMTVVADRENSRPVAEAYNQLAGGFLHEFGTREGRGVFDRSPYMLNFFFAAVIAFDDVNVTLYVGQGHADIYNNWWIGGSAIDSSRLPLVFLNVPKDGQPYAQFVLRSKGTSAMILL